MNGNLHFLGALFVVGVCRQAGMHALFLYHWAFALDGHLVIFTHDGSRVDYLLLILYVVNSS
jgi:hypothetical protein